MPQTAHLEYHSFRRFASPILNFFQSFFKSISDFFQKKLKNAKEKAKAAVLFTLYVVDFAKQNTIYVHEKENRKKLKKNEKKC